MRGRRIKGGWSDPLMCALWRPGDNMGLQKFRADYAGETQTDGATPWYTRWMGGPTLALIRNAPTRWGARTVYLTGEPDTFFSIPAATTVKGRTVRGFVTTDIVSQGELLVFVPYTEAAEAMDALLACPCTAD